MIAVPGGIAGLALAVAGVRALVVGRAAESAAAGGDLDRYDRAAVHSRHDAGHRDRVRPRAGDADRAHLRQRSRRASASASPAHRGVRRGHQALVVGELALAQALLVGAGLLLVSFVHATRIDLGFAQHDRVLAEVNLGPAYVQPIGKDGLIDPTQEDSLHQRRARSRPRRPGRAGGRGFVNGAAHRRAKSRHAHRGRSRPAARSAAERRLSVDHAGLFPRAWHDAGGGPRVRRRPIAPTRRPC